MPVKSLKYNLMLAGLALGGVAVFYAFVLNDEARASIKGTLRSVHSSYKQIGELMDEMRGIVVEDDEYLPNRESALTQWEAIGY